MVKQSAEGGHVERIGLLRRLPLTSVRTEEGVDWSRSGQRWPRRVSPTARGAGKTPTRNAHPTGDRGRCSAWARVPGTGDVSIAGGGKTERTRCSWTTDSVSGTSSPREAQCDLTPIRSAPTSPSRGIAGYIWPSTKSPSSPLRPVDFELLLDRVVVVLIERRRQGFDIRHGLRLLGARATVADHGLPKPACYAESRSLAAGRALDRFLRRCIAPGFSARRTSGPSSIARSNCESQTLTSDTLSSALSTS